MIFDKASTEELEVMIQGLRLVRRGHYDTRMRIIAGNLLDDALWYKRALNRRPEWRKEPV